MAIVPDLRYAFRRLVRTPGFTGAAVASLTLGIATSTTVFSLLNAALLRPAPFDQSERLVVLNITQDTPGEGELRRRWSWPQFRLLEGTVPSLERVASHSNAVVTLTGVEAPEPVRVEVVSSAYLSVMRAPLQLGNGFSANEDVPGAAVPLVVVGHDLWQSRFGGDDVVGRTVSLNGVAFTIAGVTAPGFTGVSGLAQAWIPSTMAPLVTYDEYLTTNQNFISVIGRLRRGATLDRARAELEAVGARIHALQPSEMDTPEDRFSATLIPLNEARVDVVTRRGLVLVTAATVVLLLVACANVTSLLLGRAAARRQEIAVRLALGASRWRLIRQLLVESGLLAAVSGILALLATGWATALVRIPPTLSRGRNFYGAVGEFAEPGMDWRVLAFAMVVCAGTVVLFGLTPALRATRADLAGDLKTGARTVAGDARRFGLREVAVGLQVALTIVLLVGCGLLLTSYLRLRHTSLGFEPGNLLTFMVRPSEVRYPTQAAPALLDRLLEQVSRVPGVEGATVDGCAPLSVQCANATLHIVGRPWASAAAAPLVMRHYVAPAHFRTLGVRLLRGRELTTLDRAGQPRVVVINQTAADRFWPGEDPIGRRVWFDGALAFGSPDSSAEIVGIVSDAAYQPLDENPMQPGFFTAYAQFTYATRMVLVRTAGDPLALVPLIASAVRMADPDLALFDVQTMEQRAQRSWAKHSAQTAVFAVISIIALCLAVTGVYAVASFYVMSRTREIGVRIALGASAANVVRTSLGRTTRVGAAGLVAGITVAFWLSRVLGTTLYDTSTLDPLVHGSAVAVLIGALLIASYLPARRALRVNPVDVLRSE